jgi:hypothetical protein
MPVGFNSPAKNFFLLGSSGAQVVTNFFKTIDQSAGTDGVYIPDEIKYNFADQKFVLAGSASDSNSKGFGWFEKRDDAGTADWDVRIESTGNTTLRAMELDSNDNIIVVGKTGTVPWIAKYSNGGVIDWQSTTNTAEVEYTGITSDSNGNYYACGSTTLVEKTAFVEKFDTNGTPGWGKAAFMLGRDVVLYNIAANSRGEVVAVGYLEDNLYYKGYIVKIDTNTGEVLWDRTLQTDDYLECTDVYIDSNDQIYVTAYKGSYFSATSYLIKYTAEGNMIWQRETNNDTSAGETIIYQQVHSDGETEQTVVFGTYKDGSGNEGGVLSKYSKDGSLVWRRTLFSTYNNSDSFGVLIKRGIALDADPSFYYLLFVDGAIDELNGTPDRYTYGKVSSSGNGLGDFEYFEGTGQIIDYKILNFQDKIGRLSDGSLRQDTSDLIIYPFNANKILFDDLATRVANKKRQMDDADSFEYFGGDSLRSPAPDFVAIDATIDMTAYSAFPSPGIQATHQKYNYVGTPVRTLDNTNNLYYLTFDGIDDHLSGSNVSSRAAQSFSVEMWCRPTGTITIDTESNSGTSGISGQRYVVGPTYVDVPVVTDSSVGVSVGTNGIGVYEHGASYLPCLLSYEASISGLTNIIVVYNNRQPFLYVNGVLVKVGLQSNRDPVFLIGSFIGAYPSYGYFQGDIYVVRYYDNPFTTSQVYQHYNATKESFIGVPASTDPGLTSTRTPA